MAHIDKLAMGTSQKFDITYTAQESDMGREGLVCNVTAKSARAEAKGTSPVITMEAVRKALGVTKTVSNTPADRSAYASGEDIEFDIAVTNTGNQTLTDVEVSEQTDGVSIVEGTGYEVAESKAKIATLPPKKLVTVDAVKHVQDTDLKQGTMTNTAQAKSGEIIQSGVSPVVYFAEVVPKDFSGLSWDSDIPEIAEKAAKNRQKYLGLVEKEKTFTADGKTYTAVCVDVAHFEKADGSGNAGFVFQFKETTTARSMEFSVSEKGAYIESIMYKNTLPVEIFNWLQTELKSAICEVKILYNRYNGSGQGDSAFTIDTTTAKLFLPSNREIWGTTPLGESGSDAGQDFHTGEDGTQLEYWVRHPTTADHIKYEVVRNRLTGWWTRSMYPYTYEGHAYNRPIIVSDGGYVKHTDPSDMIITPAPCFCI